VENLYARFGETGPNFCFAGHTDVVPPGDEAAWTEPPFEANLRDGFLWGRGAVDMKGAIAAFVAAAAGIVRAETPPPGSISLLITGDEEGPAIDGTKKLLEAVVADGEKIDHCLVGEPTCKNELGDTVKVGRRGSLNGVITVTGRQGHVAYPDAAENPIPALLELLARLMARPLDDGAQHFQPSNLEITSIDVSNPAHNVIPARASAKLNIRFNPKHTGAALEKWIEAEAASTMLGFKVDIALDLHTTGEAFLTPDGPFTELLADAVEAETGARPGLSTGGGTSDARFITNYAPVAELGLVGTTMHKVDEHAPVEEIRKLQAIYAKVLALYFERFAA
ncbi:MAG: succinyl-diaminopimelate desuccinylase, partial [Maricaulaceae bacterium]|jgi:succinyl-diaminopimelate desuccinylase